MTDIKHPNHINLNEDLAEALNLSFEEGWNGCFTRDQAKGAQPNGSRIMKAVFEPEDTTPIGEMGTVLGSINNGQEFGYFVEWDHTPKLACLVIAKKIAFT